MKTPALSSNPVTACRLGATWVTMCLAIATVAACGSVETTPDTHGSPAIPAALLGAADPTGDDAPSTGNAEADTLRLAALASAEAGDYPAALASLDAAEKLAGVGYTLRVDRAIVHGLAGDAAASLREAERALTLRPGVAYPPAATAAQVEALLWLGDRSAALRIAEGFVNAHPNNPASHYALGKALLDFVRAAEAADAFRDALRLAPNDYAARVGLVGALASGGKAAEAAEILEGLDADHPDDPWLAYQWGIVWQARGDNDKAIDAFKLAIDRFAPQVFADAHFLIARIYIERKEPESARPYLEYFVDNAPPHAAPERRYAIEQLERMSK